MEPTVKSFLNYLPDETDDLQLDAELSRAAYKYTPSVRGWIRDEELSNQNRSVYTKQGKAKVAFRGTDLSRSSTRWDDIGSDALILLGLQDKGSRFKNAQKTTELAIKKYGKENVSVTGHSLGGSQSAWVSRKSGVKGSGFNTGWGPRDSLRKLTYEKFTNITTKGDIVSAFGKKSKRMKQIEIAPSTEPHKLENFLNHPFPKQDIVMSSKGSYTPRPFTLPHAGFENSVYGMSM